MSNYLMTEVNFKPVNASKNFAIAGVPLKVSFTPGIRHNTSGAAAPTASYNIDFSSSAVKDVKFSIELRRRGS